MALASVRLLFIGLLAGALAACTGSGSGTSGPATPTVVPSTAPVVTTATCPPGSDPDAPGPARQARPQSGTAAAAFDRQSARVVHVDAQGETWTFDVCTNTWEQVTTRGEGPTGSDHLFYDPADDVTYAISTGTIRYFDVETSVWTTVAEPRGVLHVPGPPFVMDPVNRVIYGYDDPDQLWAYDIASNTGTEVEPGAPGPSGGWAGDPIATFDPSVGRIVLYGLRPNEPAIAPQVERARSEAVAESWTFDLGTGVWNRVGTRTSTVSIFTGFFFLTGTEMTYDEATRSTVVVDKDGVSVIDASANRWRKPQPGPGWPDTTRVGHGLVDDVVNGRVLLFGGSVPDPKSDWQYEDGTDMWAYDVAANTWTELVPPLPD